jgi:hypothetical protein
MRGITLKSAKPLLQLTGYYIALLALVSFLFTFVPALHDHLPIGGTEYISSGINELMTGNAVKINHEPVSHSISFSIALTGVLLLMLPVAWVYMGARRRKGREQAFILTVLLLPVVVAGIVLIVQNSLALAFSLAGIVAGVRFRLTLDDSLDAIYIFVAIGAGLAAGTDSLEVSIIVTLFFNYLILILWQLNFGSDVSVNHWFTRIWMNKGDDEISDNER